jgi:hypothetical protein
MSAARKSPLARPPDRDPRAHDGSREEPSESAPMSALRFADDGGI